MNRILIVEGDRDKASILRLILESSKYICIEASDDQGIINTAGREGVDLVIVGTPLPKMSLFQFIGSVRLLGLPIVALVPTAHLEDRDQYLEAGASVCVEESRAADLLPLYVSKLLLESGDCGGVLRVGDLEVNFGMHRVRRGGEEIHLSPREYNLLVLFVRNPYRALSHEAIYEQVWGMPYKSDKTKAMSVAIARLRQSVGWENEIVPIRKYGYRFDPVPDRP